MILETSSKMSLIPTRGLQIVTLNFCVIHNILLKNPTFLLILSFCEFINVSLEKTNVLW